MLEEYKIDQPKCFRLLVNSINKNRVSHAYLFETNGYSSSLNLAIAFAKFLICPTNRVNNKNCEKCNICYRIDNNNYPEIKIINPDGLWIKKNQLEELQMEFINKSVEGNKKIYIINNAEKLNNYASNSILKFLEEPQENIIAILITNNKHLLLDTIISRCQIVSLNKKQISQEDSLDTINRVAITIFNDDRTIQGFIDNDINMEKIQKIVSFINFFEKNGINTLMYTSKLWHEEFKDKEDISIAFEIIILFYRDVMNFKLKRKVEIFNEYNEDLIAIARNNSLSVIVAKINIILDLKEKIKININNSLLMDKFIMALEEVR